MLEECASVLWPAAPRRTPALAERFANFRRICEQSGRDPAEVRLSTTLPVCCGPTRGEAARRAAELHAAGADARRDCRSRRARGPGRQS
jgi:alkanesulfonate monooxygenase SsuD/methylene tetrahydromethanopterin reductase-like flavin-dependent oxidoreductase (luciferase family)